MLSNIYLFIMFLWAYPNVDKAISTFYLIGILFVLIADLTNQIWEIKTAESFNLAGLKFAGPIFMVFSIALGVGIYIAINAMGTRTGGVVIGVPVLATVTSSTIIATFMPALTALLGIVENQIFFTVFRLLTSFGYLAPVVGFIFQIASPVIALLIVSSIFALFHLIAYSIAVGAMVWAALSFALFLGSYLLTGDTLAADTAHWTNNAAVSISKGLEVVS